jgi:predicted Zn-dependent protease
LAWSLVASLVVSPLLTSLMATPALAQGREGISFIRDAEIEHNIRHFATPVFEMAELDPEAVQIYIVNDATLNAFVAGGQRLFLHTGLLQRVERPSQLIGVIAHETGHIAGGHLSRTNEALRNASAEAIVAMVLGGLIAAAGAPGPAIAVLSAGQHVAERSLLKYTRGQESAADQAAITFLNRTKQSSTGLVEFLDVLGRQESLVVERQDPYTRTHPISTERIQVLREQVLRSPYANQPDSPDYIRRLQRIQAKLLGYIGGLGETLKKYPVTDITPVARYARAFAYYRQGNLPRMMSELDPLIAAEPDDPFYHEIKGQALFEHGRINEAVAPAREAVKLAPREPLLRYLLGQVLLGLEKPEANRDAIIHLEESARQDADYHGTWVLLAIAYGREENFGMAALASAERFLLEDRTLDARGQAERAKRLLPLGAPAVLRAQDIIDEVARLKKEESER